MTSAVGYLDKPEIDALLAAPDRTTAGGFYNARFR